MASVAEAAEALTGRRMTFGEALAEEGARPAVEDAAQAIGWLVRAAAIAFAPERILVTGEGIDLLGGSLDVVSRVLESDWREDLELPELVLQPLDFRDFARGGLTAFVAFVQEARQLTATLGRVLSRIESDPSGFLTGNDAPEYKGGK